MSEEAGGQTQTPWYKTGRGILIAVVSGFVLLLISTTQKPSTPAPKANTPAAQTQPAVQQAPVSTGTGKVAGTNIESTPSSATGQKQSPQTQQSSNSLSNDNYYTNVDGNQVHSPAYSNTVPEGATAICRDGTYSFSQHRRGTCSYHGGVAQWL